MEYINKLLQRATVISPRTSSPSPTQSSGGDNAASKKNTEHEVKVRFAREFTDVGSITCSAPESLSSASSFQSLSSTLSTKSSSGIYPDFILQSPSQDSNDSYVNSNISGLDDLISGCAEIHLNSDDDQSYRTLQNSEDFSQDQLFASATDQSANISKNLSNDISLTNSQNAVEVDDDNLTTRESLSGPINSTEIIDDEATFGSICIKEPVTIIESNRRNSFIRLETVQRSGSPNKSDLSSGDHQTNNNPVDDTDKIPLSRNIKTSNFNSTTCLSSNKEITNVSKKEEPRLIENTPVDESSLPCNIQECNLNLTVCLSPNVSKEIENSSIENSSLNSTMCLSPNKEVTNVAKKVESRSAENNVIDNIDEIPVSRNPENSSLNSTMCLSPNKEVTNVAKKVESRSAENNVIDNIDEIPVSRNPENSSLNSTMCLSPNKEVTNVAKKVESRSAENNVIDNIDEIPVSRNPENSSLNLTMCLSSNKESTHVSKEEEPSPIKNNLAEIAKDELDTLNIEQPNFEELQFAAEQFANDVYKSSLQFSEENEPFIDATSEIFQDPTSFDFLIKHGNSKTVNRLRSESLYVKFDPLVADTSMTTQGNIQFMKETQNDKNESIMYNDTPKNKLVNSNTPKCNPAIAAIDRLLFYSPISTNVTPKINELQKKETRKNQFAKESESGSPPIIDVNMSKELELVRSTVLQLEEKLEKQKKDIQENMETIKGLETRYDQLKNHAKTELEKANYELDAIRKQHEDETTKLCALLRRAELKSNSLAGLVEQKTKENKELTQILDEVIARSYGGNSVSKSVEHEVKIRFAREFADVGSITHSTPESLSPASSFQSLSILSTKSICTDFVSSQILDDSYVNSNLSNLEDRLWKEISKQRQLLFR
ncbi:Transforming acidic coiled-coil-containing protein 3 [Melipona quadrifasciata]|uniref:Transforming acidic coiled-coil-containing protein 3 n=1 Tax=Melipona quadrifasciata TaxID=166423 RepID=A0A0M8ZZV0_9HYME|nr:Transforming acidic coiled-coil-containing protein 3 [Melipona quadrifasciata]